jgi:hypothetical protein
MGLPHLLMVGGALLLVVGCIGSGLQKNVRVTSDPKNRPAEGRAPPAFIDNVKVSRITSQISSRATSQPVLALSFQALNIRR